MVKLIKGQNDLLSQYPDCINEWDFKKTTHFHQILSQQVLQKKSGGFAAKGILMNKA